MTIQAHRNNPFQLPQFGQKPPVQPQPNPFRPGGQVPGGSSGGHPPTDGLTAFRSQIADKHIQPNLNSPKPHQGAGQRLFAMG